LDRTLTRPRITRRRAWHPEPPPRGERDGFSLKRKAGQRNGATRASAIP